jgi:hypothetical protein
VPLARTECLITLIRIIKRDGIIGTWSLQAHFNKIKDAVGLRFVFFSWFLVGFSWSSPRFVVNFKDVHQLGKIQLPTKNSLTSTIWIIYKIPNSETTIYSLSRSHSQSGFILYAHFGNCLESYLRSPGFNGIFSSSLMVISKPCLLRFK